MAAIIQKPDTLSLTGNMKKFILSSGTVVSFTLKEGAVVLLDATYEPGTDGRVTIDVRDIVESRLSYSISNEHFYPQTGIVSDFTAIIDGSPTMFRAIRAGVANLADTPANWLSGNFLTWQPVNKQVTYYSPEWITYYATQSSAIKLKAYYDNGSSEIMTLGEIDSGYAYTANVQYAVVAGILGQKYPQYYEVYAENKSGARLSYIQRYLYSEVKSEQEQWFLFENSLGGLDTIRAYGDTDFTGEHQHKISTTGDESSEYDIDTNRKYNKNTGHLDEYERRWLLDFFPSRAKYIYTAGAFRKIVVSESDVKYAASDLPSSYTFKYSFSDALPFLNLIRNEESIPENITIPDIDSPDFILPPRLAEYPRVPLSEGVMLPAFEPHSETPGITTVGEILSAAVIEVLGRIQAGEGGGELVEVLRSADPRNPSDFSVFSSLATMLKINQAIEGINLDGLDEKYISKTKPDEARKVIKFLEGIIAYGTSTFDSVELENLIAEKIAKLGGGATFGNFITGLPGEGASVGEDGHAEFDSAFIRKFLEVPELRYNKVSVYTGVRWDTFGAGIIESVEIDRDENGNNLDTGIIILKLEEGEYGAISEDDRCQGIFHNFSGSNDTVNEDQKNGNFRFKGFNTVYFQIIEILDTSNNGRFRYRLRPVSDNWYQQHHPSAFMHFAAYANPYDTDRQACVYTTGKYTIRLDNMTGWEYGEANIYGISGKLDGFKMGETIFQGHGNVFGNAYIYGHLQGIEEIIRENIQVGGKNLLREHALQFAGKYWGGDAEWRDIDIDSLINLLTAENGKMIVTENNLLIEF